MKSDTEEYLIKYNKYILIIIGIILIGIIIYGVSGQEMVTAQITKSQTGLTNGSWINLSNPVNATEGTLYFEIRPETWTKKRAVLIDNTGKGELVDKNIDFNISYFPGMKEDFSDIRFYNDSSGEQQYHWFSNRVNGSYANVTISLDYLAADSWTNSTYYMYYSNPTATYNNSLGGSNTFLFYDDFESYSLGALPANWRNEVISGYGYSATSSTISGDIAGVKVMKDTSSNQHSTIYNTDFNFTDGMIEVDFRTPNAGQTIRPGIVYRRIGDSSFYNSLGVNPSALLHRKNWLTDLTAQTTFAWQSNKWYTLRVIANSTTLIVGVDGTSLSATDSTYTSGKIGFVGGYSATLYYDNIRVRKYASTEPSILISDDEIEFFF